MGNVDELAKTKSKLIPADATKIEDLEKLINETVDFYGRLILSYIL